MASYPTEVNVSEAKLAKLTQTYKAAYKQIYSEIAGATSFGSTNRRAILAQITVILEELGKDTQEYIDEFIPSQYETGADEAVSQLKDIEAPVKIKTGFNRVHKDAIAALVDDTAKAFGESLTGVNRSAQLLLGKISREQITQQLATGQIGGAATKRVQKQVIGLIQDQGIAALVDKSGRKWELDDYTEMLIRTKAVEARNTGLKNRLVENGYDLVQVSSHNSQHEACRVWEGKILSITGETKGYPTLIQAERDGLFHPNCKHAINGLRPELAKETMAYDQNTGKYVKGLLIK